MGISAEFKGVILSLKGKYVRIRNEYNSKEKKEKIRIAVLTLSSILFLDYVMFSYHVESNIFDIFPSIPVVEDKVEVDIYIPSEEATEIISESREIHNNLEKEVLIKKLFSLVAAGSYYENTALNVPVKYTIKKIWISDTESGDGRICTIDLMPAIIGKDIAVVKNSEALFREALEKTILENVQGIKKVMILEKGVPFRKLWEM
jgi:hypothetical protein